MFRFFRKYPWIFIVLAFLVLIGAWTTAYILASKVPMRELKLPKPGHQAAP